MSYLHTHSHETKPMSVTRGFSACADGYSATFQHFEPKKTFCFVAIVFWPTTLLTCNAGIAEFDQAAPSVVAIERILMNQPINLTIVTIVIFEGERSTTMYNSKTMQNKHLWSFLPPRHFRSEVSSFWAVKCPGIPCRICWTAWESQSCLHWTLVDCESWVD